MKHFYAKVALHKPFANKPVLRCRGGRFRFIPASGLCPWQIKRLCSKLLLNATYGKLGPSKPSEDSPREAYYGRRYEEMVVPTTSMTKQPLVYYSSYPASMLESKDGVEGGRYEEMVVPTTSMTKQPLVYYSSYPASMLESKDGFEGGFTRPFLEVEIEAPR
jgi:hypothetical protein